MPVTLILTGCKFMFDSPGLNHEYINHSDNTVKRYRLFTPKQIKVTVSDNVTTLRQQQPHITAVT